MSREASLSDVKPEVRLTNTLGLAWQNTLLRLRGRRSDAALVRLSDDPEAVIAEFQERHLYFRDVETEEERVQLDLLCRGALRAVLLGEQEWIDYKLGELQKEVFRLTQREQAIGRAVQYLTQEEE